MACEFFKNYEKRDPSEIILNDFAAPLPFRSQRDFVRKVLHGEVNLRTSGTQFVPRAQESAASLAYRNRLNLDGSPSDAVASGYRWAPGTEMTKKGTASGALHKGAPPAGGTVLP
jgi:hypothetical protein